MIRIFVSRGNYDCLIVMCPEWMAMRWRNYLKQWGVAGVHVTGTIEDIESLQAQLEWVNQQH